MADAFPPQEQEQPGLTAPTEPTPDHGEDRWKGSGRLTGKKALITGGDSGIGRAVAIAYAREGADVAISYLPEEQEDAESTGKLIEEAGRKAVLLPGDITDEDFCDRLVDQAVQELGGLDILINNAAYQKNREGIEKLSTEEFDRVMKTNIYAMFWITRAAAPHLGQGGSIINTTSIQSFDPSENLLDYATTKGAITAFTKALAGEMVEKGVRVNGVAPGPIWTPLIPATGWPDKLKTFGQDTPLGRAGQPWELAGAYVFLAAEQESSYITGEIIGVTGGKRVT